MNKKIDDRWDEARKAFSNSDKNAALYLLRSLASDKELAAYREIGNIYELGGGGVEIDYKKAFSWYKKSVDEADDALGYYGLGRLYYLGRGVERNYESARWYFEQAASADIALANLMLGRIYNLGLGVEKDTHLARKYFNKAGENGYVQAIKNLGHLEIKDGNIIKGISLQLRGITLHLILYIKSSHDPRLRSM